MNVLKLDHLVLTVANIDRSVAFYCRVLGMEKIVFGADRIALAFGQQKINLHQQGQEFEPKAQRAMPGSADLCFITETDLETAMDQVASLDVNIIEGPVTRTGALGPITSFYFRDPDGNLIEVSNQEIRHNSGPTHIPS
ncbi:MAG: VOC family protein [Motiliproteus sp.]